MSWHIPPKIIKNQQPALSQLLVSGPTRGPGYLPTDPPPEGVWSSSAAGGLCFDAVKGSVSMKTTGVEQGWPMVRPFNMHEE